MVGRFFSILCIVATVGACASSPKPISSISIPVTRIPTPPAELIAPIVVPDLRFVSPSDPKATTALTPEGEAMLRLLIGQMLDRLDAWEAWSGVNDVD